MYRLIKLGFRRSRSRDNYRQMQKFIAEGTLGELRRRGIDVSAMRVLEFGAGRGGYSLVFNEAAREFLATDLNEDAYFKTRKIPFKKVDLRHPVAIEDAVYDLVVCSSLIEHIAEPAQMLQEAYRILRPGGILYLSFPPFYSLSMVGGHNFKPFHFLGERFSIKRHNARRGTRIQGYADCYGNFGLFPLTIDAVQKMIQAGGFTIVDRYTRLSPFNTAKLPWILKDLMTWHACILGRKPKPGGPE
jgi:SAM-dependent methyltransferase